MIDQHVVYLGWVNQAELAEDFCCWLQLLPSHSLSLP